MPKSCTYVYVHFVWATWDRQPFITPDIEEPIYQCIAEKCHELQCGLLVIGGIADHVHVLARLHPTVSIAKLAKGMKGGSSHLMTHMIKQATPFRWQGCYGAFSVSQSHVRSVNDYIKHQKQRHAQDKLWPLLETCEEYADPNL
ncbi:MAG: IS200/IS605 family transposase [Abitibacteriaceae bacterium]|nr:IS200/IS605 family transposase [Abditibacteriaceae bacterium]MBV9868074.1 IS200/IS605 family transposase [Abditibacteriaceae bacterium]